MILITFINPFIIYQILILIAWLCINSCNAHTVLWEKYSYYFSYPSTLSPALKDDKDTDRLTLSVFLVQFCCRVFLLNHHAILLPEAKYYHFIKSFFLEGDFLGGSDSKESACNAEDPGSIPGSGKSPGEENGNPLQHYCLENSMDRDAQWATIHWVAKSRTWLSH